MPLGLVRNFVPDEENETDFVWKYTDVHTLLKVNRLNNSIDERVEVTNAEAQRHLAVLQHFWNGVPRFAFESVEESVIRGLNALIPKEEKLIAQILNALNFASDMNSLFWSYCRWLLYECDGLNSDAKSLMVWEHPWKIVKEFSCSFVIRQAISVLCLDGYKLYEDIYKCGWHETDKELWFVFLRESFRCYTDEDSLSDIVMTLPTGLQSCDEVISIMIEHQTLPLLKHLVRYGGETSDRVVNIIVEFLCSTERQNDYIHLFNLVVYYLYNVNTCWQLLCGFNSELVTDAYLIKVCTFDEVPDSVFEILCERPDDKTATLRRALFLHPSSDFELPKMVELYHQEDAIEKNIVALVMKLNHSSVLCLLKMLLVAGYFKLLKVAISILPGPVAFMQLAQAQLCASEMLQLHPFIKYEVDSSSNEKLSLLFNGDLCRHSRDSTCTEMFANFVMRIQFKNSIQKLQNDPYTLKSLDVSNMNKLCAMCQNIYQAGLNCDEAAIQTFLANPRYVYWARFETNDMIAGGLQDGVSVRWRMHCVSTAKNKPSLLFHTTSSTKLSLRGRFVPRISSIGAKCTPSLSSYIPISISSLGCGWVFS